MLNIIQKRILNLITGAKNIKQLIKSKYILIKYKLKNYPIFILDNLITINRDKIRELVDFSCGSPGRYLINLQSWLSISIPLRQKLEIQLTNQIELLQLAKEITEELNLEQQLWFIDFQQSREWEQKKNSHIVKQFDELRKQLLKYVQPRLAWEVTLLEINLIN